MSEGIFENLSIPYKVSAVDQPFRLTCSPGRQHMNQHGSIHGGILYLLCVEAVALCIEHSGRKGAGTEGSIHYYRPAFPDRELTISVSERKAGRRLGTCFAEIRNDSGELLCDCLFSVMFAEDK